MKQSDHFRENAANCMQLAEQAARGPVSKRYTRMAQGWSALAQEQAWLDGEVPPWDDLETLVRQS